VHANRIAEADADVTRLRSLLFVPGDRPDRMTKAMDTGVDAIILDLEDSVAPARKSLARSAIVAGLSATPRRTALFVRINPIGSEHTVADLALVNAGRPDAVVLPKAEGADSVRQLLREMSAPCPILPIATETPKAVFALGTYQAVAEHLIGVTWGAEDLPAAIGASSSRDADGRYRPPYELARSLTLFAAHAAGVPAIETVYPAIRDLDGLRSYARHAMLDGFAAMMAVHPSQVPIINDAFTPTEEAVRQARAIVATFAANPGAGVLELGGRMIDAPHLKQAKNILQRAGVI
jgi:citrate lyase subunit beta / citryl-CoA lyase